MWWKPNYMDGKKWDCICTRGPWRWNSAWCADDDTQRFTQRDLTCFTPESNIEGLFYLGDPFDITAASAPLILTSYTSGFVLHQNDFFDPWRVNPNGNQDIGVLLYNPVDDWSVRNKVGSNNMTLCLRLPELGEVSEEQGLFIYNVSLLYQSELLDENEQGLQVIFKKGCTEYSTGIWFEVFPESIYDKNMVIPSFDPATASEACQICSKNIPKVQTKLKRQLVIDDELEESFEDFDFTAPDLKNGTLLSSMVNLQSERIGLYWAKRLFRNESDYLQDDLQEIDILIKAAVMAYGTCDMNYIPKHFYQYFLLMFRQLLTESFKKYSPMAPIPDDYYNEINTLLDSCKSRMRPIVFKNVQGQCPFKYAQWMNGSETVTTEPPDGYRASVEKHDYLVEFVWKLKEFLHYNCFEEFKNSSVLHDIIQHQIEALFTEDILLRWSNPSKSFEMYNAIFKVHFSLESTMYNFEGCIKAVHDMSQYKVWLKRPSEQPHRQKRSIRKRRMAIPSAKDELKELETESKTRRIKRTQVDVEDWSPEDTDYNDEESVEIRRTIRQTNDLWMAANRSATCLSKVDTFLVAAGFSFSECW